MHGIIFVDQVDGEQVRDLLFIVHKQDMGGHKFPLSFVEAFIMLILL